MYSEAGWMLGMSPTNSSVPSRAFQQDLAAWKKLFVTDAHINSLRHRHLGLSKCQ